MFPNVTDAARPPRGGWVWTGFQPVTDISILEALLNTKPADLPQEELV